MKKFKSVFSGFFLLFLIICARAIFSQPAGKILIQDKIFNEQLSMRPAHSALALESIFPTVTGSVIPSGIDRIKQVVIQKQSLDEIKPDKDFDQKIKLEDNFLKTKQVDRKIVPVEKYKELKIESHFGQKQNVLQITQKAVESELIQHESLQGTINSLPYERIKGVGVRFRYTTIPEELIGHFWRVKSVDLRGKTIRIYYSGIVPHEITFLFSRSYSSVKASYRVSLIDSSRTQVVSLKVPENFAFKDISIFEFQIVKSRVGKNHGDFLIEKVEIGSNHDNFRPDKAEHRSHSFSFGGPYLQSNIWGGEVFAS